MTFRKKEEEIFLGRDINRETTFSNQTAELIDTEVKQLILDAMTYVRKLLSENRTKLDKLAEQLMEKEILDSEEVDSLIREGGGAVAGA